MEFMSFKTVLLQIFFWLSAYADLTEGHHPPAPILSWSPSNGIIVRGKPICLTCSLPEGQKTEWFYFYQLKEVGQWDQLKEVGQWDRLKEQTQNILEVPMFQLRKQKETFVCAYWGENSAGRPSRSQMSNPAVFSVTGPPPPPSLSADPSGPLYLPGEKVILQCSAPRDAQVTQYQFSHLGVGHSSEKLLAQSGSAQLTLTSTRENSGLYSCRYSESESERNAFSDGSQPIKISVTDPPPSPVLIVDPPSGEVNENDPLLITCLVNGSNTEKRFHFYKDGVEISSISEESLKSTNEFVGFSSNASVNISKAKPNHTGGFACSYEENMNNSWIRSPWSQKVNVTVCAANSPASSLLPFKYLPIPFVILMFPLAFYCWRRKKTETSKRGQESEPGEQKDETELNDLGTSEPQTAASQDSGVTYALLSISSASSEPVKAKRREEESVVYSKIPSRPIRRTAK